jgi:tetratricopeptide (TPR) repeat protein
MKKNRRSGLYFLGYVAMLLTCVFLLNTESVLAQDFMEDDPQSQYTEAIKINDYTKALEVLLSIPEAQRSIPEKKLILNLETFVTVESEKPPQGALQTTDEDVGPDVIQTVKRCYRVAQKSILAGETDKARDLLIYNQFIYPNHFKSKKLLELALNLPENAYKVEDVLKKYLSRANNYFYGGNYMLAKEDLGVLKVIDKDNSVLLERLGSTYYMMNEKQKAIDEWTAALFIDSENKELRAIIDQTKLALQEEAKAELAEKKKSKKVVITDAQVMGVYKRQSQAFEMAESLKKKGLTVSIEETDKGKWAVKVSRAELLKLNQKGTQ